MCVDGTQNHGGGGRGALYKVAYDEAVRALSAQQAVIDSVRSRAGLLFSVAAITTSFLGAQALDRGSNFASWMALASFVAVSLIALALLWPRHWEFSADPSELISTYIEADGRASIEELHRDLSLHMHGSYLENWDGLRRLAALFQAAGILLTIETILWIVAIALIS